MHRSPLRCRGRAVHQSVVKEWASHPLSPDSAPNLARVPVPISPATVGWRVPVPILGDRGLACACPYPRTVAAALCCSSGALPPELSPPDLPPEDRRNYSGVHPLRPPSRATRIFRRRTGGTTAAGFHPDHGAAIAGHASSHPVRRRPELDEQRSEEERGRSRTSSPRAEATVEDAEAEVVRFDHEDLRPSRSPPSCLTHQNHAQRNRLDASPIHTRLIVPLRCSREMYACWGTKCPGGDEPKPSAERPRSGAQTAGQIEHGRKHADGDEPHECRDGHDERRLKDRDE